MNDVIFKLNQYVHVSNRGHILYLYEKESAYIENAVEYIRTAMELNQTVLFIDTEANWMEIQSRFREDLAAHAVHFAEANDFYVKNETFCCDEVVAHFQKLFDQLSLEGSQIRTWANVQWVPSEDAFNELVCFEKEADKAVQQKEILSVCAYCSHKVPAFIGIKMTRSHSYIMTDTEIFVSTLYEEQKQKVIFPSLSEQKRIQSEMDLYKQKLDFAHVVSHEVRNPLTVIKAYCSLMLHKPETLTPEVSYRLSEIKDYVDIIDQELAHIIRTEQMLTNDHLWTKEWVNPLPILEEVVNFMAIKAKSQNQHLVSSVAVTPGQVMHVSKVGLRLIVSNLLSNAIKYNEESEVVEFDARLENDQLTMRIEDHGSGMTPEQLDNLYIKYSKLNHDKAGQGIGLCMVKKLLDDSSGTIQFESAVEHGTVVRVTIPFEE